MTKTGENSRSAGPKGLLIVFCGIDGSGKSTQEELLAQRLRADGQQILQTKQPTDAYRENPLVREYLDSGENAYGMTGLALLAAADRQAHVGNVILPTLATGTHVLCNRYLYSSIAYFSARGLEENFVRTINKDVPTPDLTVLTDIDPVTARRRVVSRDGSVLKFEERDLEFMGAVRAAFLRNADASFLILDGTQPAADLHAQVVDRVAGLLDS